MIRNCLRLLLAVALIPLGGCADPDIPPAAPAARPAVTAAPSAVAVPAEGTPEEATPPVPVLRVGQKAAIDLFGDGQATVTVTGTNLSPPVDGRERLVVTVDIKLVKAGNPVTGGPENFRFRDNTEAMYPAQVSEEVATPGLRSVNFTVAGQASHGHVYFDLPPGAVRDGYVQLMTGSLVHAVWQVDS